MRVIVWPASRDASSFYRLRYPAAALAGQGADVRVLEGADQGPRIHWDRRWVSKPGDAQVVGCDKPDADVVVLQRPARRYWAQAIPYIRAHGVKVVVDTDDDFSKIPRSSGAWWTYFGGEPHAHGKWVTAACRAADVVTCTTPALAGVYGFGKAVVIPNMVPAEFLRIRPHKWARSVGWSGSVDTHPTDLQVTGGAVGRALSQVDGWQVRIVGTGYGVQHALELTEPARGTGWTPILDYAHRVARLELGIVPLTGSAFNAGKSSLKLAELASLGVAAVASPTPDNARLNKLGVGVLANSPQRWLKALTRLMRNDDQRAELAQHGCSVMASQTYERQADLWADVWLTKTRGKAAA